MGIAALHAILRRVQPVGDQQAGFRWMLFVGWVERSDTHAEGAGV
jgi:predicted oxidoreductase